MWHSPVGKRNLIPHETVLPVVVEVMSVIIENCDENGTKSCILFHFYRENIPVGLLFEKAPSCVKMCVSSNISK